MKRITLVLLLFLLTSIGYSQFTENFESGIPSTWAIFDNGIGSNPWTVNTALACEGTTTAFVNARQNIGAGNTSQDYLVTPLITIPTNGQLVFDTRSTLNGPNDTTYQVRYSTTSQTDINSFTTIQQWSDTDFLFNLCEEETVDIGFLQGQQVYIAFVVLMNQPSTLLTGDRWVVDNVRIVERCLDPTNITVGGITQNSASISWLNPGGANQFEVEIVQVPNAPTGVGVLTGPSPYVANGLLATTQYQVYVRAVCSLSNSAWVGPVNFITTSPGQTCASAIQITGALPYTTTDNTSNYSDDVDGTPGATGCGTTGNFLNGNNVYYSYTADFDGVVQVTLTPTGNNSGLFIYNSCANVGVSCIAGVANTNGTPRVIDLPVTSGQTYFIVISTSGTPATIPYTLTLQFLPCAAPTNLTAIGGLTSALLGWDANGATSWEYVVQTAGSPIPTVPGIQTSTNQNVTVTTLFDGTPMAASTQYQYWVRRDCGDGTFSPWAGPFLFATTQIPATLNYEEGFEGTHGWSFVNGTSTNIWTVGTATNNGGTSSLYISNNNGTSNTYTVNAATVVQAYRDIAIPNNANEGVLSFDWKGQGESTFDYLRVWVVPVTYLPTQNVQTTAALSGGIQLGGNFNLNANFTTQNFIIQLLPFAGTTIRLLFEWRNDTSAGTQPPAAIDNVNLSLVTCPSPSSLAFNSVTQDSVNVTWSAPALVTPTYDYYYSTSPASPNSTTVPIGNQSALSLPITGLSPSTTYYFWVRSNCDVDGVSFWVGPIIFTTTQIPATLNYEEGFEGTHGWSFVNGTSTNRWVVGTATNNGGTSALYVSNDNGTSNVYTINTATVVQAYRDIAIPANANEGTLSFDWRAQGESVFDYLRVWIVPTTFVPTQGVQITASATNIQLGANFNQNANYITQNFVLPLLPFAGTTIRLVFEWRNDGSVGTQPPAAIDNVNLSLLTCPSPTNLSFNNVTQDSANIAWTAPALVTPTYDYYLSTSPASPNSTTIPTGNQPELTLPLTGLTPSTTYYFWVRSNCGTDGVSFWVGPISFTTTQIPAQLNYEEGFEGTHGWSFVNGTSVNRWTVGNATNNGGTQAMYISNDNGLSNLYTTGGAATTVHAYRDIEIPSAVNEGVLSFDWRAFGESTLDFMRVWIVPTSYLPTQGTLITAAASGGIQLGANFNQNGNYTNQSFILSLAPYAGTTIRLVFEWRNDGSVGTQPPAAIDNVNLSLVTCPSPIDLIPQTEIGSFSVDLSWTPVGTETQWEVFIQPLGAGAPGAGTVGIIVDQPNYTFTAEEDVFYEFYVRAICGENDQSFWAGPVQFSIFIPPGCASVDVVGVGVDIIDGNVVVCPDSTIESVDLSATFFGIASTTSYEVNSIPYEPPFPFTGGIQTSVNIDDVWSNVINLPFNFCFFGNSFSTAQVSSNGALTFGTNFPPNVIGSSPWAYTQNVPDPTFPIRNAIYGVYQDIDPAINNSFANPNINYQVLGTSPCRALVVSFSNVAQFGCTTDANIGAQTSQIVIYEISNIIEVYVERRVPCTTWNGGRGVIGIQNAAGTLGYTPPGRNTGTWTAIQEAWRFLPNGASDVDFEWLMNGMPYSTANDISITLTPEQQQELEENLTLTLEMEAVATYSTCTPGEEITRSRVVDIVYIIEFPSNEPNDLTSCSATGVAEFNLTLNNPVLLGTFDPALFTITYFESEADALALENAIDTPLTYQGTNGQIVWVRISDLTNSCFQIYSFQLIFGENTQSVTGFSYQTPICLSSSEILQPIPVNGFTTGGIFSSSDGLVIDPSTGEIALATSLPGTYTIRYEVVSSGCLEGSFFEFDIEILPTPTLAPVQDETACNEFGLPDIAVGNYYTQPNGQGEVIPSGTVITETSTIYVYVSNNVCSDEAVFTVTIQEFETPTFDPIAVICQNSTAPTLPLTSLNGITGTWSPDTIDSSVAGTTTFTFTPEDGVCATTFTVDITVEEELTPTFNPIADLCLNGPAPVLLSTSINGVDGTWLPATIDTSVAGQFTFIFTPDAGVCATQGSLIVNVTNTITPTFTAYPTLCQFSEAPVLPVSSDNGVTGSWLPSAIDTSIVGDTTYTFTPDPNFACALPVTITVNVEERITPNFAAIAPICLGGVAPSLELTSTNGITGTWNPAAIDTSVAGSVVYTFTPADGICASPTTLTVEITAPTQATFTQVGPFCQNDTVASLPTTSLEGVSGSWNSSTIDTSVAGDFVYTFTPTSGLCALGTTMTITITAPTQAVFTQIANLCQGSTAPSLPQTSNNGVTGTWNPSTINTTSAGITTYTFTPTTGLCALGATMTIEVFATPFVEQIENQIICAGQSYTLQPLPANNAYFTGPNGSGASLAVGSTVSSSQTIYIYAQSGTTPNCTAESSFTVTVVEAVAQELSDVEECGSFALPDLDAGNAYYTGPNGTGTQLQAGSEVTTTQTIYVLATNGACTAESSFEVTIVNCAIQKGISPNGDGLNDFFDLENFNVRNLSIFNRYGRKVYSRVNYENEWFGQSDKGDELPDGTYYYVIEFSDNPTKTGWIYINRER